MKCCTILLFLTFSFSTEKTGFELPVLCGNHPSLLDVGQLARVMQAEARGEGDTGMLWVGWVLMNRSKKSGKSLAEESENGFCKSKSINPGIKRLALKTIQEPVLHSYTYFCNLKTAKNKPFVRWAKTRQGKQFGKHCFF